MITEHKLSIFDPLIANQHDPCATPRCGEVSW